MKHKENLWQIWVIGLFFALLTLAAWCKPPEAYSDSERRQLAQKPTLSASSLSSGSFMTQFERYSQDQFPQRDRLRTLKALFSRNVLGQLDNNDIYSYNGYLAKQEYPLNADSVSHAAQRFTEIYETYLAAQGSSVYLSVIPDKGSLLARESGHLSLDCAAMAQMLHQAMPYAQYIEIADTLQLSSYYKTDTHWRQEALLDTAARLAEGMGISLTQNYTQQTLPIPFSGVYAGQSALNPEPEELHYLTNEILEQCVVTNWETNTTGGIYDLEKAARKDPYDLFLSGPVSLLTIDNPNCESSRELIVFRDSFASSLIPLLCESYRQITLVDIRYLRTDMLDRFVDFHGQDVLFLYSSLVLNHSESLS